MIDKNDFKAIFDDLEKRFRIEYAPDRLDKLYYAIRHVSDRDLEDAIGDIIDFTNRAPTIGAIKEKLREKSFRAKADTERSHINSMASNGYDCKLCKGTGMVLARKKTDPIYVSPFCFKCNCEIGTRKVFSFPVWGDFRLKDFTLKLDQDEPVIKKEAVTAYKPIEPVVEAAEIIGIPAEEVRDWSSY